MVKFNSFKLSS